MAYIYKTDIPTAGCQLSRHVEGGWTCREVTLARHNPAHGWAPGPSGIVVGHARGGERAPGRGSGPGCVAWVAGCHRSSAPVVADSKAVLAWVDDATNASSVCGGHGCAQAGPVDEETGELGMTSSSFEVLDLGRWAQVGYWETAADNSHTNKDLDAIILLLGAERNACIAVGKRQCLTR